MTAFPCWDTLLTASEGENLFAYLAAEQRLMNRQHKSCSQAFQRFAGNTKLVPLGSPGLKPLGGGLEGNALQDAGGVVYDLQREKGRLQVKCQSAG